MVCPFFVSEKGFFYIVNNLWFAGTANILAIFSLLMREELARMGAKIYKGEHV
jgi:hypothetical protein